MRDGLLLGTIALIGPLLPMAGITFVLHYFIALKSPPSQRAAWITGIAYLITTVIFSGARDFGIYAPLAAIPGAIVVFWFWRMDFRRGWIADPEAVPEGASLANDDWRIGLLSLAALMVLGVGIGIIRAIARGAF